MKITILNGENEGSDLSFTQFLEHEIESLNMIHDIELINLASYRITACCGCWSCWWKTPGTCPASDDSMSILRKVIHSDVVVFSSPLVAGFTSSLLKRITDKFVVLVHPYITLIDEEYHHEKRYAQYPKMAVYVGEESYTDKQDMDIVREIYTRMSKNFHTDVLKVKTSSEMKLYKFLHVLSEKFHRYQDKTVATL